MYLDLTDVLRGPGQTLEKPLRIEPMTLGDIEIAEPVEGVVRVENARQNLIVRGKARTTINLPCARCLENAAVPLKLEFEANAPLSFFSHLGLNPAQAGHGHGHGHHRSEPEEEDEVTEPDDEMAALFDGHMLDLLELVRQAIELQAPIQPLCSPDCPGLPEAAQYSGGEEDARWGALQNWKNGDASASQ